MAHGGYGRGRVERRRPLGRRSSASSSSNGLGVDKRRKKPKTVSLKNQIRSTERMLRKELPEEVRQAQEKKLEDLKWQQELQNRLALESKIRMRDKKIKFFERRKVERMIRRLEKQQRASTDPASDGKSADELFQLRQDLEYIRFFPKNEKYVSLFAGGDDPYVVAKRNKLRDQIKVNLAAAAASGKDLEETASDDDAVDTSGDDFFTSGSSSDEAEADDEWTDKSAREPASSASGKATSGMSSDEKNQRQRSARILMPPPRSLPHGRNRSQEKVELPASSNTSNSERGPSNKKLRYQNKWKDNHGNLSSSSDAHKPHDSNHSREKFELPSSSTTSHSGIGPSNKNLRYQNKWKDQRGNLSSSSDAHKPRRKRRPKKKKQV